MLLVASRALKDLNPQHRRRSVWLGAHGDRVRDRQSGPLDPRWPSGNYVQAVSIQPHGLVLDDQRIWVTPEE